MQCPICGKDHPGDERSPGAVSIVCSSCGASPSRVKPVQTRSKRAGKTVTAARSAKTKEEKSEL